MTIDNLLLAEDLYEKLLAGEKEITLRLGYRDVRMGELVFAPTGDESRNIAVNVYMVVHAALRDIPDILLETEGFKNHEEAVAGLRRFYPDVNLDSEVTVILFELKKSA